MHVSLKLTYMNQHPNTRLTPFNQQIQPTESYSDQKTLVP